METELQKPTPLFKKDDKKTTNLKAWFEVIWFGTIG